MKRTGAEPDATRVIPPKLEPPKDTYVYPKNDFDRSVKSDNGGALGKLADVFFKKQMGGK